MTTETAELDTRVRVAIYEEAVADGSLPTVDGLSVRVGASPAETRGALERLAEAHIVALQRDTRELLMAMPYSAIPTAFEVRADGTSAWGNCVWDGLGIAALTGKDAVVRTGCGCCGTAMDLRVTDGRLEADTGVIHFAVPVRHWWDDVFFT